MSTRSHFLNDDSEYSSLLLIDVTETKIRYHRRNIFFPSRSVGRDEPRAKVKLHAAIEKIGREKLGCSYQSAMQTRGFVAVVYSIRPAGKNVGKGIRTCSILVQNGEG